MERVIGELLREAASRLKEIGAGNPYLEAEYLMEKALGEERVRLLCRKDQAVSPGEADSFRRLLDRRLLREPLQYILGTVPFCDLELEVGPGVLIPRSETEILVERVAEAVGGWAEAGRTEDRTAESAGTPLPGEPLLVDVGTGSGAILLALLTRLPGWRGIGIDRSRDALTWARRNIARSSPRLTGNGSPPRRPALVRGDLLGAIRRASADVVVSNPPYVNAQDLSTLAPEIRDHEPREALDGGYDGMEVFPVLVEQAAVALKPGGLLAMEMAPDQGDGIRDLLERNGAFEAPSIFRDLAGRPRGVLVRKREGAR